MTIRIAKKLINLIGNTNKHPTKITKIMGGDSTAILGYGYVIDYDKEIIDKFDSLSHEEESSICLYYPYTGMNDEDECTMFLCMYDYKYEFCVSEMDEDDYATSQDFIKVIGEPTEEDIRKFNKCVDELFHDSSESASWTKPRFCLFSDYQH